MKGIREGKRWVLGLNMRGWDTIILRTNRMPVCYNDT